MSQDYWKAMKEHEAQLRQAQSEKTQRTSDEQAHRKEDDAKQQSLREQERRDLEQRQTLQRQAGQQKIEEQRNQEKKIQASLLAQSAEELRIANQQMRESYLAALQKYKEEKNKVWKSSDGREFRSPLERDFWDAWIVNNERASSTPIEPQYHIGRYFVDFAHIESQTVIEIDGYETHFTRRARNRDSARQHWIEDEGWFFLRFTGTEVFHDVQACVNLAWRRIQKREAR